MTVLPIRDIGDPVLRTPAKPLTGTELADPETQSFIDDLIETKRHRHGAGIAANQVGDTRRIAVVEVEDSNPRYPYKPPYPLTVLVNPRIVAASEETVDINEGCLSVPDLRGEVPRHAEIDVEFEDRDGNRQRIKVAGLSAGTFQHEIDHLDGVLFVDRVADPHTLSTWEIFELYKRDAFEERARAIVARYGS